MTLAARIALRTIGKSTGRTVVLLVLAGCVALTPTPAHAAPIVVFDTLGTATPDTTFSVFGSTGTTLGRETHIGPQFTLTQPTTITEIGAFVENCFSIVNGVPQCPSPSPLVVEVRRSVNGVPDPSAVLGSFTLSDDDDPFVVSYESTGPSLTLEPGVYFALFASQGSDQGVWLTTHDPYFAPVTTLGILNVVTGASRVHRDPMAARILGETLLGPPASKDQCKNGGWRDFGDKFKNQGQCVAFVQRRPQP